MNWDTVQQFVRILSGWLSASLVTAGILDQSNATILTGAIVGIAQVAWWWFWNRKRVE